MRCNLIFDLDETLINTSKLRPHRATTEGKIYVANNPDLVETSGYSRSLRKIVGDYHSAKSVSIVTNAPEGYARALLQKHGFPKDIPLYAGADKPSIEEIKKAAAGKRYSTLMIGDSAQDALTAHQARIASVAVTWGSTSTVEQLEKAEPTKIISNPENLEGIIIEFEKGIFKYKSRKDYLKYMRIPEDKRGMRLAENIEHKTLGDYYRYSKGKQTNTHSKEIMVFNSLRDFTLEEVKAGATADYFNRGIVIRGSRIIDSLLKFRTGIVDLIDSFNLKGESYLLAAPNSCPEYCYKTDSNQIFISAVAGKTGYKCGNETSNKKRIISRIFPKVSAHSGEGRRDIWIHHTTMGFSPVINLNSMDNIVIFDNVMTSGAQIESAASMLRHFKFKGKIYSVTLGDTVDSKLT